VGDPIVIRRLAALSVVVPLVALGSLALAQSGGGRGWIDQPLASVVITSAPVAVTAHLTHPAGVTEARLVVNGADVEQKPAGGETLETLQFSWVPPEAGEYLLEVFGFGGGQWGTPGAVLVNVQVGGEISATTDSTAGTESTNTTMTLSSTTTTRPGTSTTTTRPSTTTTTTTPCSLGVPSPRGVSDADSFDPTLWWTYSGCQEPEGFEIQVSRSTDFTRLEWSGATGGSAGSVVASVGSDCTTYFWRVRTYHLGDYGSWSSTGSFFIQTIRSCP
jgi:hypothetical protein